jgi:thioredoxin reductase (NADPH)
VTLLNIGRSSVAATTNAPGVADVERLSIHLSDLRVCEDRVTLSVGPVQRTFDVIYLALGCSAQHDLACSLGATCDESGALQVNTHGETSVSGLYAAGDVVRGLNQVAVAAAESAIAATDIHNKLRGS